MSEKSYDDLALNYKFPLLADLTRLVGIWTSNKFTTAFLTSIDTPLNTTDIRVIWWLSALSSAKPTELARRVGVNAPNISKSIARLNNQGLLEITRDRTDGRSIGITLSVSGKEIAERLIESGDRMVEEFVADWDEEQLLSFSALLAEFTAAAAGFASRLTDQAEPN